MHQTTVRFGPDLWEALEVECARIGVSAAQFLREAALARLAYTAGRRGDPEYEDAFVGAGIGVAETSMNGDGDAALRSAALEASSEQIAAASAVSAQSELVWRRAREVRARAAELRSQRRAKS
jgi:hypothetical protein